MTESIESQLETLTSRLEALETELERRDDRIDRLEAELREKTDWIDQLEAQLTTTDRKTEAALNKATTNKHRCRELQARELEKGAHLHTKTIDPAEIDVPDDTLEKITKANGRTYYRLPEQEDPIDRTTPTLAHSDLLPIQQFARMDADMRRSTTNALPTRLAAALWEARTDPTVGDNPWKTGCRSVREYITASDLKHWIRRQEQGISDTYAKKLVSRTIDAILDLSNHRLAVRKRTQRKNGLEYTERRLLLPSDVEIPGETSTASDRDQGPIDSTDEKPIDATEQAESTQTGTETAPETADVLG